MNFRDFKLMSNGLSDIGLVRSNNEDVWSALNDYGFFILADGMGGHNAGEIAAKEAVTFISTSMEELFLASENSWNIFELSSFTKLFIENANSWVYRLGKEKKEYRGMGTTICALLFHEKSLIYGHVGDSRIYRFRNEKLEQLTVDHSLKNELISQGRFSNNNEQPFPYKNVLTRAIGTQQDVEVETHITPVNINDVYLMCSDGLSDYVPNKEILSILKEETSLDIASAKLIERAKLHGGQDNITVVIVRVEEHEKANLSKEKKSNISKLSSLRKGADRL